MLISFGIWTIWTRHECAFEHELELVSQRAVSLRGPKCEMFFYMTYGQAYSCLAKALVIGINKYHLSNHRVNIVSIFDL